MSHLADDERAALCELLDLLGPDDPTLCAGWQTRDLAAHLVVREGRLDAMPGIALPFVAGWTARVQDAIAGGDFKRLVNRLRHGPPIWSPMRPAPLNEAANGIEFFVHHEDVRRAQDGWRPRNLDSETQDMFWRRLKFVSRSALRHGTFLRHQAFGLDAMRSDNGARLALRAAQPGQPSGTLVGLPCELLLYFFGRRAHSLVDQRGDVAVFG
jgi:uncharacterized protein (TIGR03085 family)